MSRNLRLSSEIELAAIMQRMRSPRSEMREAETAHRIASPPPPVFPTRPVTIYPLIGLCRAAGLPDPVPEYRWHPVRKYRADYALVLERVLIEYDGGLWINGGHTRGKARLHDMEKDRAATLLGWRTLRYAPNQMAQTIADLRILLAGYD